MRGGLFEEMQRRKVVATLAAIAGILSMLAKPVAIFKRFKTELHRRFEDAYNELQKIKQQSRRKDNIVPLPPMKANGNGAIVSNGARRA